MRPLRFCAGMPLSTGHISPRLAAAPPCRVPCISATHGSVLLSFVPVVHALVRCLATVGLRLCATRTARRFMAMLCCMAPFSPHVSVVSSVFTALVTLLSVPRSSAGIKLTPIRTVAKVEPTVRIAAPSTTPRSGSNGSGIVGVVPANALSPNSSCLSNSLSSMDDGQSPPSLLAGVAGLSGDSHSTIMLPSISPCHEVGHDDEYESDFDSPNSPIVDCLPPNAFTDTQYGVYPEPAAHRHDVLYDDDEDDDDDEEYGNVYERKEVYHHARQPAELDDDVEMHGTGASSSPPRRRRRISPLIVTHHREVALPALLSNRERRGGNLFQDDATPASPYHVAGARSQPGRVTPTRTLRPTSTPVAPALACTPVSATKKALAPTAPAAMLSVGVTPRRKVANMSALTPGKPSHVVVAPPTPLSASKKKLLPSSKPPLPPPVAAAKSPMSPAAAAAGVAAAGPAVFAAAAPACDSDDGEEEYDANATSGNTKGPWSPEEDELLASMVKADGPRNWRKIAARLNGR